MITLAINLAVLAVLAAMTMNMVRLVIGPHAEDRILALDTLYVNSIALFLLVGIVFGTPLYFEAALVIAMLGFVSTIALAKYLDRGNLID